MSQPPNAVTINGRLWVPTHEAARHCGRTTQTIRRWLREKKLSAHKTGTRRWVVDWAQLCALVAPPAPAPQRDRHMAKLVRQMDRDLGLLPR